MEGAEGAEGAENVEGVENVENVEDVESVEGVEVGAVGAEGVDNAWKTWRNSRGSPGACSALRTISCTSSDRQGLMQLITPSSVRKLRPCPTCMRAAVYGHQHPVVSLTSRVWSYSLTMRSTSATSASSTWE